MKTVVGISLGKGDQDFAFRTRFMGEAFDVRRIGTNGSLAQAVKLARHWERRADAIGLGVVKDSYTVGSRHFVEKDSVRLRSAVTLVPATTGGRLGDILQEWALRHVQGKLGGYFNNANVLFFSGRTHYKLAQAMAEFTPNLQFADALLQLGVPKMLTSLDMLELYASGAHYVLDWTPDALVGSAPVREWTRYVLRKAMRDATVVVAPVHELDRFGREELAGKIVVTSTVNDHRLARFKAKRVATVIDGAPLVQGHVLGPSLLDAMIVAATGKAPEDILEDDYLAIIGELGLEPRVLQPGGFRRVNRFAFVIHPLSQEYFKNVKPIELLSQVSPPILMDTVEKVMAYAPPFVYSKVTGIRSPTGVEAEGWLISVGGTPREIMGHSPEFTYRRLLDAARMARRLGAQIMGLGAFTKVVGDAGLTVARRAPLPITTGNSYSASGALWAAHDAVLKLGLVKKPRRGEKVALKAMVVGATGAIGSVCARLLAMVAEEVYLVSPETAKLLALKESIAKEAPDAKLVLSARADKDIAGMDMIVTATSGAGKKVLDITRVKPGCVITDVARPLDLPPEEVAKRPDVLVIESGEILLPGRVSMKNIGLPKNVAYACLAETIVLALEGRFENFTVGRSIEWEKVREIYRLGRKHGMKLAAISGVNGPFTDADIRRVRRLALAARARAAAEASPAGASEVPAKRGPPVSKGVAAGAARRRAAGPAAKAAPAKRPGARRGKAVVRSATPA
ncbi:MAG: serine carboxypeptidase [Betaproteobacteria bacterium]|nr:MAG: serine carboxypeptidase [Betaproteobacteria bacterium]